MRFEIEGEFCETLSHETYGETVKDACAQFKDLHPGFRVTSIREVGDAGDVGREVETYGECGGCGAEIVEGEDWSFDPDSDQSFCGECRPNADAIPESSESPDDRPGYSFGDVIGPASGSIELATPQMYEVVLKMYEVVLKMNSGGVEYQREARLPGVPSIGLRIGFGEGFDEHTVVRVNSVWFMGREIVCLCRFDLYPEVVEAVAPRMAEAGFYIGGIGKDEAS